MLIFPMLNSSSDVFALSPFEPRRDVLSEPRMEARSGCKKAARSPSSPLPTPAKVAAHGLGDTGVERETPTSG